MENMNNTNKINTMNKITEFQQYIDLLDMKTKKYIHKRSIELSVPYIRMVGLCYLFQNHMIIDIILDGLLHYIIPGKRPWNHFYNPINYVSNDNEIGPFYQLPLERLVRIGLNEGMVWSRTEDTMIPRTQDQYPTHVPFSTTTMYKNINKTDYRIRLPILRYGDVSFDHYLLIEYKVKDKLNYFSEINKIIDSISLSNGQETIKIKNKDIMIYPHKEHIDQYWISASCICIPIPIICAQYVTINIDYQFTKNVHLIQYKQGFMFYNTKERRYLASWFAVIGSFEDDYVLMILMGDMLNVSSDARINRDCVIDGDYGDYDDHDPLFKPLIDYYKVGDTKYHVNSFIYN